jgi:hypothetical protein
LNTEGNERGTCQSSDMHKNRGKLALDSHGYRIAST